MELGLNGKHALVSGGSKGIGLSIKKALEAEGVECTSWSRREGIDLLDNIPIQDETYDILIHCAGGFGTANFEEDYKCMCLNYHVLREMTQDFLERQRNWGRIIAISSIYGKEKGPNPIFTAAKAAQIAFMKSLAGRYEGITFNTICSGYIKTKPEIEEYARKVDAPIGMPEDIANAVIFLCSEKAKFINGSCLVIDGGFSKSF